MDMAASQLPPPGTAIDKSIICTAPSCNLCQWLVNPSSEDNLKIEPEHLYERAAQGCAPMSWILEAIEGNKGYRRIDSITIWARPSRDQPDEMLQPDGPVSRPGIRLLHDFDPSNPRMYNLYMYGDESNFHSTRPSSSITVTNI